MLAVGPVLAALVVLGLAAVVWRQRPPTDEGAAPRHVVVDGVPVAAEEDPNRLLVRFTRPDGQTIEQWFAVANFHPYDPGVATPVHLAPTPPHAAHLPGEDGDDDAAGAGAREALPVVMLASGMALVVAVVGAGGTVARRRRAIAAVRDHGGAPLAARAWWTGPRSSLVFLFRDLDGSFLGAVDLHPDYSGTIGDGDLVGVVGVPDGGRLVALTTAGGLVVPRTALGAPVRPRRWPAPRATGPGSPDLPPAVGVGPPDLVHARRTRALVIASTSTSTFPLRLAGIVALGALPAVWAAVPAAIGLGGLGLAALAWVRLRADEAATARGPSRPAPSVVAPPTVAVPYVEPEAGGAELADTNWRWLASGGAYGTVGMILGGWSLLAPPLAIVLLLGFVVRRLRRRGPVVRRERRPVLPAAVAAVVATVAVGPWDAVDDGGPALTAAGAAAASVALSVLVFRILTAGLVVTEDEWTFHDVLRTRTVALRSVAAVERDGRAVVVRHHDGRRKRYAGFALSRRAARRAVDGWAPAADPLAVPPSLLVG